MCTTGKFQSIQLFTLPSCTLGHVYRPAAPGHHKPRIGECVPPASSNLSIYLFCPRALLLMCTGPRHWGIINPGVENAYHRSSSSLFSYLLSPHVLLVMCTGPQHWSIINPGVENSYHRQVPVYPFIHSALKHSCSCVQHHQPGMENAYHGQVPI